MRRGSSIIELLVAFGIAAILLPAILTGLVSSREGKAQQQSRGEATLLLRETMEAVKSVRQNSWVTFAVNGTYHPVVSSGSWTLVSGTTTVNGLVQQVTISDTNRDNSGTIVTAGGSNDPSTKKVYVRISWTQPRASYVDSTVYLTRYRDNISFTETTQTQFNTGSKTNVKVQSTSPSAVADDGEIVLSQSGGYGDWCTPALTFTDLDLPKSGVANAISATPAGNVTIATGTGDNASGVSYANVTVTDPNYPTAPVASTEGTFDGYKTNGVFTEADYAYLATDTNAKQVVIVDLNQLDQVTGKYTEVGTLNIGSASVNAKSIFVANDVAYVTGTDSKLYLFNVTARTGSHSPISNVTLAGVGTKVVVVGTNAFIAVNNTASQLQIVDASNVNSPNIPAGNSISVDGLEAKDVYVNVPQNRAYLVTSQSSSQREFFLIDLATKTVSGSYDTSAHGDMNPKGVVAVSGARVIIVGTDGQEYQVLRVDGNYESNPTWCGGLDVNTGINGIATVFTDAQRAYSYIITGDANAELKIIEGGPGASGVGSYVPTGTFISGPYGPTTLATSFNRFIANIYQPIANDVQVYMAVADVVSGSCTNADYNFVGPNGGAGAFTTSITGATTLSGSIPFGTYSSYTNPGKCFKYKVVLNTTDSTLTPTFKDITVNYSP